MGNNENKNDNKQSKYMAYGMCFGMIAGSVVMSILAMFGQFVWGWFSRWNWTYDRYDCWIDNF